MGCSPQPPGDRSANLEAVEVGDGRLPSDGRETARVMVLERFRGCQTLDTSADDVRDISAALFGGWRQPRDRLPVPGEARGDVADHKDDSAGVDGEIRPYCNAAGLVWLRAEPLGGRRGLYARSPQHRPRRQSFAREQHAVLIDVLDLGLEADRYPKALEGHRGVDRERRWKRRQQPCRR